MSIRQVARRVAVSFAATAAAGTFAALALGSPAGADRPRSGDACPGSAQCADTVHRRAPFDSGQIINVVDSGQHVPSQRLTTTAGINIVECAAPDGVDAHDSIGV